MIIKNNPLGSRSKLLFAYKLDYYIQHKSATSEQKVHGTQSIVFAICFSYIRYLLRSMQREIIPSILTHILTILPPCLKTL